MYFIEDDSDFHSIPKPTDRVGVDGKWIGATHGNSYFSFPVEPGDHALCANWQSIVGLGGGKKAAAVQFTAQAGESYYFRMHEYFSTDRPVGVDLVPVDPAEGQLLVKLCGLQRLLPKVKCESRKRPARRSLCAFQHDNLRITESIPRQPHNVPERR